MGHPGLHRHIRSLMMRTKMALETSVFYGHLTTLIAQEDFIKFSCYKSYRSYNVSGFVIPNGVTDTKKANMTQQFELGDIKEENVEELLQSHQENLRNHLLTLEKERIRAVRIKS
jgi:hypothetical protein